MAPAYCCCVLMLRTAPAAGTATWTEEPAGGGRRYYGGHRDASGGGQPRRCERDLTLPGCVHSQSEGPRMAGMSGAHAHKRAVQRAARQRARGRTAAKTAEARPLVFLCMYGLSGAPQREGHTYSAHRSQCAVGRRRDTRHWSHYGDTAARTPWARERGETYTVRTHRRVLVQAKRRVALSGSRHIHILGFLLMCVKLLCESCVGDVADTTRMGRRHLLGDCLFPACPGRGR